MARRLIRRLGSSGGTGARCAARQAFEEALLAAAAGATGQSCARRWRRLCLGLRLQVFWHTERAADLAVGSAQRGGNCAAGVSRCEQERYCSRGGWKAQLQDQVWSWMVSKKATAACSSLAWLMRHP